MPPVTRKRLLAVILIVAAVGAYAIFARHAPEQDTSLASPPRPADDGSVQLSDTQLRSITIAPVANRSFANEREAIGSIDFNEDKTVPVSSLYQGKIIDAFAQIGDQVEQYQTLYTIDSPDLVQAESTLIAAAGVYDMATRTLARAKDLYKTQGVAQKELDQAVSDQQTAEASLKAARAALSVFGKTPSEIDRIVAERKIDPVLIVQSPIKGVVTARSAQPGLLVQPGNAPAPYTVADVSTMWMNAEIPEGDSASYHVGDDVKVTVTAFPGRIFPGRISVIGAAVDSATHRIGLRSEVSDPRHELRPGMFANFTIRTGAPATSLAIPANGVVREGDGTMTVWVTSDRRTFTKKTVTLGLQQEGYDQVLAGLKGGELAVTDNALFLSNMNNADSQ